MAEHYNQVVRNRSERKESSIRGLRNFNNACKSVLIQSTCEHLQRVIDPRSQDRHSKHRPPRLDVLDLCCGKGGDVGKLRRLVRSYVAADIAEVSVQENVLRSKDLLDESVATCFFATDCFKTDLARAVEGAGTAAPRQHYYHFVNCQFSLHYSCATEAQLRAFLRNASSRLARGGRFVATFPNMDTILARLRAARTAAGAGAAGLLQFGNGIFFVRFTKDPLSVDMSKPENVYGLEYVFHLEDAIDDCAEFLVHLPTLERIAAEHGLRIVKRWDSLLQLESSSHFSDAASHYARYGGTQLTREEQEAVSLYQAVVFEQTLAAHPAVADVAANRDNNAMLVPIKSAMMQRFA